MIFIGFQNRVPLKVLKLLLEAGFGTDGLALYAAAKGASLESLRVLVEVKRFSEFLKKPMFFKISPRISNSECNSENSSSIFTFRVFDRSSVRHTSRLNSMMFLTIQTIYILKAYDFPLFTVSKIHKNTKTKCIKDPTYAIILKRGEYKDNKL